MTQSLALGKYRLLGELGRGGMATVFLAAVEGPSRFTKLVVVKQLKAELASEVEFREMFLDEARLAARLNHPNIVQTYEVMEGDGKFLLVMEYLEGQPLSNVRSRLGRKKAFQLSDQVRVLADVLEGLHAAHEASDWDGTPLNVVHRDVSPHNVFVTYEGQVKVVDFGVAKASTSSQHTQTGVIKGKISYMAPEQALGRKVDRRADVFAVGIMLWEAIAGRRLWKDLPDAGIIHFLACDEVPKIADFAPDADPGLVRACNRALACKPDERFATAAEMRSALDDYLATIHPRPQVRELGASIAAHFAEERARIRAVVERQLSQGPMLVTGELASMGLPQLPTPEPSVSTGMPSAVAPGASVVSALGQSGTSPSSPSLAAQQGYSSASATGLSMSSATAPPLVAEPPRNRNLPLVISVSAAAAGLLCLAAVIGWRGTRPEVPVAQPVVAPSVVPAAPQAPEAAASAVVATAPATPSGTASAATSGARPKPGGPARPPPAPPATGAKPPPPGPPPGDIILNR